MDSIFKDVTPNKNMFGDPFTIDSIASKLVYFETKLQLLHWQTMSFAEHKALGSLYEFIHGFKDDVVEKLMGYTNTRVKSFKLLPITENVNSLAVVNEILDYAYSLVEWAESKKYCDIENLAQSLSGEAAKTRYLLSLA